jgi:GNAT superfamily N-acetyltransferase
VASFGKHLKIVDKVNHRADTCNVLASTSMNAAVQLRLAVADDIPLLQRLIELSVRGLQAHDYTPVQLERALASVYGVDTRLIADGTYFVAETDTGDESTSAREFQKGGHLVVACGGWSKRKTLYGADHCAGRIDDLLNPEKEPAKIRAFFVHPEWTRRGIGGIILEACENAAKAAGFRRLEMGATLTGVPFYKAKGYLELETLKVPLGDGEALPIVRMGKDV